MNPSDLSTTELPPLAPVIVAVLLAIIFIR